MSIEKSKSSSENELYWQHEWPSDYRLRLLRLDYDGQTPVYEVDTALARMYHKNRMAIARYQSN